jgi:heavy metal translocating P-type ATPase
MTRARLHHAQLVLLVTATAAVLVGGVLAWSGRDAAADALWIATTLLGIIPAAWWAWDRARHGHLGVDVIAVLALMGTLVIGEYVAGAIITVMLATGRALEARANARARRDLQLLAARQPTDVHLYRGSAITTASAAAVRAGDVLLVKPGEVVPVDGMVKSGVAVLDESTLTGEPLPVERPAGYSVRSGTVNAGGPFDLRATATVNDSTYAGIVRLVQGAEASSAPFVRLADRYAGIFLVTSLAIAVVAWLLSGDPERAVAVLVVATPCPLILAAPIAYVAGLSRAARRGVIVKGGAALERLAGGAVLLFDKTGTLTSGQPVLCDVVIRDGMEADGVLRLAASLDQVSSHVLAAAVVRAASERGLALSLPDQAEERPGAGMRGRVDGHTVTLGKAELVGVPDDDPWTRSVRRRADLDGSVTVFVGVDGRPAGALLFDDPIRLDAARTVRALRRGGIDRVVMVTGDRHDVASTIGAVIGVDDVYAERTPADKVDIVALEAQNGSTIMVGDGINDAAALAAADVGVALGARGASASSEAADAVILVDRLDRLGDAVAIARRAQLIAVESVIVGVGLSLGAMALAAAGFISPAWGALLQELIDVAVILNALRALRVSRPTGRPLTSDSELARRFDAEHRVLRPQLARIRAVADELGGDDPVAAIEEARALHHFLVTELLPHEWSEDASLYPAIDRALGGNESMASMRREHVEIAFQVRRLGRLLDGIDSLDAPSEDVLELRRLLYGLFAILRLHFAQEDEHYYSLADDLAVAGLPDLTAQPAGAYISSTTSR